MICSAVWKGCIITVWIFRTQNTVLLAFLSKGGEALIKRQLSSYTIRSILCNWCKKSAMIKSKKCCFYSEVFLFFIWNSLTYMWETFWLLAKWQAIIALLWIIIKVTSCNCFMHYVKLVLKFYCVRFVMFYSDYFNNVFLCVCVEWEQLRNYLIGLLYCPFLEPAFTWLTF